MVKQRKLSQHDSDELDLASKLSSIMKNKNLTEQDLSKALKLPALTIRRIVQGETQDPRISTLKLIANFLDVSLDLLLDSNKVLNLSIPNKKLISIPLIKWNEITDYSKRTNLPSSTNWFHIPVFKGNEVSDKGDLFFMISV